jgi:hypothetical protein
VVIGEPATLSIVISGGNTIIPFCFGTTASTTLTASASGGTPPYLYSWPGGSLTVTSSGFYSCSVIDVNGCFDNARVFVLFIPIICARDPNKISGPNGYEVQQWVAKKDNLGYTIFYENDPDFATAPAQKVVISYTFDNTQNMYSFRLGSFGFGSFYFNVPQNSTSYSNRLDVVDSLGVYVDVTAGINVNENKAFWTFQSIDPLTSLPPMDPLLGFLPVNDTLIHNGEGFVNFTCKPKTSTVTGDSINAKASIVFDINDPLATNTWTNIIDALPPSSTVDTLPLNSDSTVIQISFSGSDDPGGCGIKNYALYVSTNNSPFIMHQEYTDSVGIFTGQEGNNYQFFSIATDNVGNTEIMKNYAEATTTTGIKITANVTDVSCYGMNNGSIDISVLGGTSPYTYMWSDNSTSEDLSGIPAGIFTLTITDSGGKTASESMTVAEPMQLTVSYISSDVSCFNGSDGSINITASGGTAPYSYYWINGQTNSMISGLSAAIYSVVITDYNNCTSSGSFQVSQPDEIIIQSNVNNPTCSTCNDASIIVDVSGGTSPYTFIWSNGQQTNELNNIGIGNYTVTIADVNDCSAIASISVTSPVPVVCQTLDLVSGWNIYSTFIDPVNPLLDSMLSGIVTQIIIVKNGDGNVYIPSYGVDNINDWSVGEGYQIKMLSYQNLEICGNQIIPELTPVSLNTGWQLIAYLRSSQAPVNQMMSNIVSNIIMVKNGAGKVYWPVYSLNQIGNMVPGMGYQIKTSTVCTLVYPPNSQNFLKDETNYYQPEHYTGVKNTGNNMTVGLFDLTLNFTSPSDEAGGIKPSGEASLSRLLGRRIDFEIGIFSDDGLLVGSGVLNGEFAAITVWGDDETTPQKDGLLQGENFVIKSWNKYSGTESQLIVTNWMEGDDIYTPDKISIAGKFTGIDISENQTILYQNIPNPFRQTTEIRFYIPGKSFVELTVYNILGEKLETLISKDIEAGEHKIEFKSKDYQAGTYFYRMVTPEFVGTKVMNILKM